ncbi:hypothetical protein NDU88_011151 [Pleurodeles waltl]|uniref:Uncharacterized protein n=1 Tax=Pleurodeles waltl TaxID=8319 RepID=A0AAV7S642_PLEWA|nr:hypothetical protein NDU88_011151 [Pleurodeles waltl]
MIGEYVRLDQAERLSQGFVIEEGLLTCAGLVRWQRHRKCAVGLDWQLSEVFGTWSEAAGADRMITDVQLAIFANMLGNPKPVCEGASFPWTDGTEVMWNISGLVPTSWRLHTTSFSFPVFYRARPQDLCIHKTALK